MFETAERATALAEAESSREAHHRVRRGSDWEALGDSRCQATRALVDEARGGDANEAFRRHTRRHARRGPGHGDAKGTGLEADEAEARENVNAGGGARVTRRRSRAAQTPFETPPRRARLVSRSDDGPAGRYLSVAASVSRSPLLARPIAADASSLPPSSTALAAKSRSRFASFYAANERGLARGLAAPRDVSRASTAANERRRASAAEPPSTTRRSSSTLTDVDFRLAPASSADAAVSNSSADERRVGSKPRRRCRVGTDARGRRAASRGHRRARSFDSFGNLPVHLRATPESSGAGTSAREEENARGVAVDAP